MPDPFWILGVPPIILLWVLVKCQIEVSAGDFDDQRSANKAFILCVIDDLVPKGLPDPDRYADEDDSG
jgi:hypothetical protein